MSTFLITAGLLVESDVVSLSPSLKIEDCLLVDRSNDAKHRVSSVAQVAILHINRQVKVADWMNEMSKLGISSRQQSEIITFLNAIGGMQVRRSVGSILRISILRLLCRLKGLTIQNSAKRKPGNVVGVSYVVLHAMTPVLLAVLFTGVVQYGANMSREMYLYNNLTFVATLWLSTCIHEFMHILIASKETRNVDVIQKSIRIGVLHKQLSNRNDIASAVIGPLSGLVSSFFMAGILFYIFNLHVPAVVASAVGLFHTISWLPIYGDGQTILRHRRGVGYATST